VSGPPPSKPRRGVGGSSPPSWSFCRKIFLRPEAPREKNCVCETRFFHKKKYFVLPLQRIYVIFDQIKLCKVRFSPLASRGDEESVRVKLFVLYTKYLTKQNGERIKRNSKSFTKCRNFGKKFLCELSRRSIYFHYVFHRM